VAGLSLCDHLRVDYSNPSDAGRRRTVERRDYSASDATARLYRDPSPITTPASTVTRSRRVPPVRRPPLKRRRLFRGPLRLPWAPPFGG